jgi:hypothetical protein
MDFHLLNVFDQSPVYYKNQFNVLGKTDCHLVVRRGDSLELVDENLTFVRDLSFALEKDEIPTMCHYNETSQLLFVATNYYAVCCIDNNTSIKLCIYNDITLANNLAVSLASRSSESVLYLYIGCEDGCLQVFRIFREYEELLVEKVTSVDLNDENEFIVIKSMVCYKNLLCVALENEIVVLNASTLEYITDISWYGNCIDDDTIIPLTSMTLYQEYLFVTSANQQEFMVCKLSEDEDILYQMVKAQMKPTQIVCHDNVLFVSDGKTVDIHQCDFKASRNNFKIYCKLMENRSLQGYQLQTKLYYLNRRLILSQKNFNQEEFITTLDCNELYPDEKHQMTLRLLLQRSIKNELSTGVFRNLPTDVLQLIIRCRNGRQ